MKPTKKGNVICIACNSCVLYESCIYDVYIYICGAMGEVDVTFILQVDRFGSLFVS